MPLARPAPPEPAVQWLANLFAIERVEMAAARDRALRVG
jgi:hypothetical protein